MLVRFAGPVVDAWLATGPWRHTAADAWRAAPGDLIGRTIVRLCGNPRPTREIPRGPGRTPALFIEDPRLALYLDNVPLRPYAQTLGRYVIARERVPDSIVRHELEHVRQWSRFGPLYLPLYGLASIVAILAGGNRYLDNVFETVARARETEQG